MSQKAKGKNAGSDGIINVEYCLLCNCCYVIEDLETPHKCTKLTTNVNRADLQYFLKTNPRDEGHLTPIAYQVYRAIESSPFLEVINPLSFYPEDLLEPQALNKNSAKTTSIHDSNYVSMIPSHISQKINLARISVNSTLKKGPGYFVPDQKEGWVIENDIDDKIYCDPDNKDYLYEYDLALSSATINQKRSTIPKHETWRACFGKKEEMLEGDNIHLVCCQLLELQSQQIRHHPELDNHSAWLDCWDYRGRLLPKGEHTGRPNSTYLEGAERYWKSQNEGARYESLMRQTRFRLRGMNSLKAVMLYPLFEYLFAKRLACKRNCINCDGNILRAEILNVYPVETIKRYAHMQDLDFLLRSTNVRLDFNYIGKEINCFFSNDRTNELFKNNPHLMPEILGRVLLSWTFYRGIIIQMLGAAIQYRYESKTRESLASVAFLLLSESKKEKNITLNENSKKRKHKKKKKSDSNSVSPPATDAAAKEAIATEVDMAEVNTTTPDKNIITERFQQLSLFSDMVTLMIRCKFCKEKRVYDCIPQPCGHVHACKECIGDICKECKSPIVAVVDMNLMTQ